MFFRVGSGSSPPSLSSTPLFLVLADAGSIHLNYNKIKPINSRNVSTAASTTKLCSRYQYTHVLQGGIAEDAITIILPANPFEDSFSWINFEPKDIYFVSWFTITLFLLKLILAANSKEISYIQCTKKTVSSKSNPKKSHRPRHGIFFYNGTPEFRVLTEGEWHQHRWRVIR